MSLPDLLRAMCEEHSIELVLMLRSGAWCVTCRGAGGAELGYRANPSDSAQDALNGALESFLEFVYPELDNH